MYICLSWGFCLKIFIISEHLSQKKWFYEFLKYCSTKKSIFSLKMTLTFDLLNPNTDRIHSWHIGYKYIKFYWYWVKNTGCRARKPFWGNYQELSSPYECKSSIISKSNSFTYLNSHVFQMRMLLALIIIKF